MKIAILYDSKFGNTKQVAEFLADKMKANNNQIRLFRTKESKPKDLLAFQPEAILVGGPTHMHKPALTLGKYIKKLGKSIQKSIILKAAVFNCYTGDIVCKMIQDQISDAIPKIKIFEKSLPLRTMTNTNDWKAIDLPNNWKEDASNFVSAFLNFLTEMQKNG